MKNNIVTITGLSWLLAAACSSNSPAFVAGADGGDADSDADGDADSDSDSDSDGDADPPTVAASDETLPAADPKLVGFESWPIVFTVEPGSYGALACRVELARDDAAIAAVDGAVADGRCAVAWDGRDGDGGWVAPGPLTATAAVFEEGGDPLAEADAALEVVRLGIGQIQMTGTGSNERVALLWGETDDEPEGYYEVPVTVAPWRIGPDASEGAAAVDLDLADGSPRPVPAPWTDLKSPPLDAAAGDGVEHDAFNLPTAWVAGANVDFAATLSASAAGMEGGGGPTAVEIRVLPPAGTALTGADAFAHGAIVTARTTASPVPAVGLYGVELVWSFEVRRPEGEWTPIPGAVTTAHNLYGVVAQPALGYTAVPYRAWVEITPACGRRG